VIEVGPEVLELARCDAEHLGRVDAGTPARVTSDIPPATRRLVVRRDHHRCSVPGCRNSRDLHIHHVKAREHGGDHALSNLTLLCGPHHRAFHAGRLVIRGTAPHHLRFEHPDGRGYGELTATPVVSAVRDAIDPGRPRAHVDADASEEVFTQAKSALRNSGYPAAIANAAVERARAHVGAHASVEEVIRRSFRECA